jgi:hypothetical protein
VPLANIAVSAADLSEMEIKVKMADTLVKAGYDPEAVLMELGLPAMPYVGSVSAPMPVMVEEEESPEDEIEDTLEEEEDAS